MTTWRKSRRSDETGGQCVELARLADRVGVRDSQAPQAGALLLSPAAFADLVARAKRDELTL